MLLSSLIAIKLGGTWKAVLIALLCILVSPVFGASHIGCYHDWMPALNKSSVYITTGEMNLTPAFWYQFFDSVEEIMLIENKYSLDYQNSGIRFYVCRGLKYDREEIKGIINKYYGI